MRHLLSFTILFACISAGAQTYPKYNNQTGTSKNTSKTETAKKPDVEKPVEAARVVTTKKTGDFQEIMERAVIQSKAYNYKEAVALYTEAFEVSNEEQAWRALTSRATTYVMMKKTDKAIEDYTTIINTGNAPQKKLAYIYSCRARLAQDKNDMAMACADVKKAREMGLPENFLFGFDCK
jgi:tetratricopeptide (TPR) repeat protein